jgi:tRNA (cytosine38-C5)-methyltransferase
MTLFALERPTKTTTTFVSSASHWRRRVRGGIKEAATTRRFRRRFTRAARNTVREEEEEEEEDGSSSSKRTVVELFSGIGGMRLALEDANVLWNGKDDDDGAAASAAVHFIAVDNNCNANAVYRANFCSCSSSSSSEVLEGNIESIDVERLLHSSCEILTMSPPCQPYTRKGKKEREKDARSTALARIIDAFEDADEKALPKRILLENVVGFELGTERERFISSLEKHRYHVKEYVGLSPETMLGVPVKRPRYYLLARREEFGSFDVSSFESPSPSVEDIAKYLDEEIEVGLEIEKKKIEKYWKFFDVVNVASSSNVASTFTSGYGKTVFSGSYILFDNCDIAKRDVHANNAYRLVKDDNSESDEQFAERVSRSMRYFSPRELCRLHGIKEQFVFPSSLSKRQQYKLIGNGISVNVVSKLLEYLFK